MLPFIPAQSQTDRWDLGLPFYKHLKYRTMNQLSEPATSKLNLRSFLCLAFIAFSRGVCVRAREHVHSIYRSNTEAGG